MRSTEHSTDLKVGAFAMLPTDAIPALVLPCVLHVGAFAMLPTDPSGIIDIKNHSARIALHGIVTAAGQNERLYDTASDKIQSAGR